MYLQNHKRERGRPVSVHLLPHSSTDHRTAVFKRGLFSFTRFVSVAPFIFSLHLPFPPPPTPTSSFLFHTPPCFLFSCQANYLIFLSDSPLPTCTRVSCTSTETHAQINAQLAFVRGTATSQRDCVCVSSAHISL